MGKSHKVNYLIWGLLFAGISGILIQGVSADNYYTFEIPIPNELRIAGETDVRTDTSPDIPVADIDAGDLSGVLCYIKSSMIGYDTSGNPQITEDSPFLLKYPKAQSLVAGASGDVVSYYEVIPKIRCEVDGDYPMTINTASLKAFVLSTNDQQVEVWNSGNSIITRDIPIVFNHEEEITTFKINTVDVYRGLPTGDYTTDLIFQVSGIMDIDYDNFSGDYQNIIEIPRDSIQTGITVPVSKAGETGTGTGIEEKKKIVDCIKPQIMNEAGECVDEKDPIVTNIYKEFSSCMQSFDVDCLMQEKFIIYYIGSLGAIILLGAVTTRNKPMFDQLGNRVN